MDAYKKLLKKKVKTTDVNRYSQIRLKLERGQYSCPEEMYRLQNEMQDLANELGLC